MKENDDENKIPKLFDRRKVLRTKTDKASKEELIQVENELAEKCVSFFKESLQKSEADYPLFPRIFYLQVAKYEFCQSQ